MDLFGIVLRWPKGKCDPFAFDSSNFPNPRYTFTAIKLRTSVLTLVFNRSPFFSIKSIERWTEDKNYLKNGLKRNISCEFACFFGCSTNGFGRKQKAKIAINLKDVVLWGEQQILLNGTSSSCSDGPTKKSMDAKSQRAEEEKKRACSFEPLKIHRWTWIKLFASICKIWVNFISFSLLPIPKNVLFNMLVSSMLCIILFINTFVRSVFFGSFLVTNMELVLDRRHNNVRAAYRNVCV